MPFSAAAIMTTAVFASAVLCVTLTALTAAVHFPRSHRLAHMATGPATAILWGSMTMAGLATLIAVFAAWRGIPIAWAVVSGSLAVLVAPLVLQRFSDGFVDGPRGLAAFAVLSLGLAGVAIWLAA